MRIFTINIVAVLLLYSLSVFAQSGGGLKPTPMPQDPLMLLKNPKFSHDAFFVGRDYHHNTFRDHKKGLMGMADCNFTMADAANPQDFSLCEKLGLSVVVSVNPHLEGGDWDKMSDEQIDQYIKKLVKNGGKSKAIIGYHICDEPSSTVFPKLAKAVEAVRKYAPGKWSTINLYPNYATIWTEGQVKSQLGTKTYGEYLEKFVNIVKPDIITYDNYMVQMSLDLKQVDRAGKYFTNLLDVRRIALKYNIPFWNVISGNQIRPNTPIPSPANLALQAYTSLAAGAGGIRWYTYWKGGYNYAAIDENENKTLTWRYLQEINRQTVMLGTIVKQLKSTGVYFTSPAPEATLPVLPGEYVISVETDVPMMVGEFLSKDGSRYILVVNLSLEKSANFVVKTIIQNEVLYTVSLGEDTPYLYDFELSKRSSLDADIAWRPKLESELNNGLWLPAGEGIMIKCTGKDRSMK